MSYANFDTMYAVQVRKTFQTWTYSEGQRVAMKTFYTQPELQAFARRHHYNIVHVKDCPPMYPMKRVLVQVRGGVADVTADDGVLIEVVDYDNEPDAEIADDFAYLVYKGAAESKIT
jgi:hypothetical protein